MNYIAIFGYASIPVPINVMSPKSIHFLAKRHAIFPAVFAQSPMIFIPQVLYPPRSDILPQSVSSSSLLAYFP